MTYPASPVDGDFHTEDGLRRRFIASETTWVQDPDFGGSGHPLVAVYAADHGVTAGNTAAVNGTNLNLAIDAAKADGLPVILPSGDIPLKATINVGDGDRWSLQGAGTVIQGPTDGAAALHIEHAWPAALAVTAVVYNEDHDFPNEALTVRGTTKLTMAPGHGLAIGDLIKVGNDQAIADMARFPTSRTGQYAVVGDVVGDVVWLASHLRAVDSWAGTHEVWKVPPSDIDIRDLNFECGSGTSHPLRLIGLTNCTVENVRADNIEKAAVRATGCWGLQIDRLEIRGSTMASGFFPYGVALEHCETATITRAHGTRLRHLFTTACGNATAGDGRTYGRVATVVVADSIATACTGGFDTHHGAFDVTFDNCKSRDNLASGGTRGNGFSIRGRLIRLTSCSVDGASDGYLVFSEPDAGSATGQVALNECSARNIDRYALYANEETGVTVEGITLNDCDMESSQHVIYAGAADVAVNGGRVSPKATWFRPFFTQNGGSIDGHNVKVFANSSNGAAYTSTASGSIHLERCQFYNVSTLDYLGKGAGKVTIRDAELDGTPSAGLLEGTLVAGSYYARVHDHAAAAPTAGDWHVGDLVWNTAPSTGNPVGWVCTVAGAPGTWAGFGTI